MTNKEKMSVIRVIVAILLMMVAIFGMFNGSDGWGWFLMVGAVIYPSQINIDFREVNNV